MKGAVLVELALSVAFANAIIIYNTAAVVSVLEDVSGAGALVGASDMIKGQSSSWFVDVPLFKLAANICFFFLKMYTNEINFEHFLFHLEKPLSIFKVLCHIYCYVYMI